LKTLDSGFRRNDGLCQGSLALGELLRHFAIVHVACHHAFTSVKAGGEGQRSETVAARPDFGDEETTT
jgi:hypothetical protein